MTFPDSLFLRERSANSQVFNQGIQDNITKKRYSSSLIHCFSNTMKRFDVSGNTLTCTDGKTIKIFSIDTSTKIWKTKVQHQKLNLFKIIEDKLVFNCRKDSKNEIRMIDLQTHKELESCTISRTDLSRKVCSVNNRIFGITGKYLIEWNLEGNKVGKYKLNEGSSVCVHVRRFSPKLINSDRYVIYFSSSAIHCLNLQENKLRTFYPDNEIKITASCLNGPFLFLAAQTNNLLDAYLLCLDLEGGAKNTIKLDLSDYYESGKKQVIKNIIVQDDRIFLKIGKYIIDYKENLILGSNNTREIGEEPMTSLFDGRMLMYLTSHAFPMQRSWLRKINIKDLTSGKVHSFVSPFKREPARKYSLSTSFYSTIFVEGRLMAPSGGCFVLFDFLKPDHEKDSSHLDLLQELEESGQYKDWKSCDETTETPNRFSPANSDDEIEEGLQVMMALTHWSSASMPLHFTNEGDYGGDSEPPSYNRPLSDNRYMSEDSGEDTELPSYYRRAPEDSGEETELPSQTAVDLDAIPDASFEENDTDVPMRDWSNPTYTDDETECLNLDLRGAMVDSDASTECSDADDEAEDD